MDPAYTPQHANRGVSIEPDTGYDSEIVERSRCPNLYFEVKLHHHQKRLSGTMHIFLMSHTSEWTTLPRSFLENEFSMKIRHL